MSAPVTIVWACGLDVESNAALGHAVEVKRPECPSCRRPMGWWSGYERFVREGRVWKIWVRRARCGLCAVSHALLPAFILARRLDAVETIGPGLARAVAGEGMRPVAEALGVPHTTLREWRHRHRDRAPTLLAGLAALAIHLGGPAVTFSAVPERAALEAVAAVFVQAGSGSGGVFQFASVVSGGAWLAPTTTSPWAAGMGRGFMPPVPSTRPQEDAHGP